MKILGVEGIQIIESKLWEIIVFNWLRYKRFILVQRVDCIAWWWWLTFFTSSPGWSFLTDWPMIFLRTGLWQQFPEKLTLELFLEDFSESISPQKILSRDARSLNHCSLSSHRKKSRRATSKKVICMNSDTKLGKRAGRKFRTGARSFPFGHSTTFTCQNAERTRATPSYPKSHSKPYTIRENWDT